MLGKRFYLNTATPNFEGKMQDCHRSAPKKIQRSVMQVRWHLFIHKGNKQQFRWQVLGGRPTASDGTKAIKADDVIFPARWSHHEQILHTSLSAAFFKGNPALSSLQKFSTNGNSCHLCVPPSSKKMLLANELQKTSFSSKTQERERW